MPSIVRRGHVVVAPVRWACFARVPLAEIVSTRDVRVGSFASISPRSRHFRSTPITGHIQSRSPSANKIMMMMMVLLSMSAIMVSGDRKRLDGDAAALSLPSKGTTPSSDRQTELRLFLFVAL